MAVFGIAAAFDDDIGGTSCQRKVAQSLRVAIDRKCPSINSITTEFGQNWHLRRRNRGILSYGRPFQFAEKDLSRICHSFNLCSLKASYPMSGRLHYHARRSASQVICALGIHSLFARRFGGLGSILAFHRVGEVASSHRYVSHQLSVRSDYFCRLIEMLIDRDYDIVSMTEVARRLARQSPCGRKFICLSFDDGYRDNYEQAFPICASFGIPMVVHVTTGFVRRTDAMWSLGLEQIVVENDVLELPWGGAIQHLPALTPAQKHKAYVVAAGLLKAAPRQRRRQVCEELGAIYGVSFMELTDRNTLTPQMIQEMRASGLVEFGAHTVSHANLSRLPAADARDEIAESRHDLEGLLGDEVRHFAFPYGRAGEAGPREFELCRELGFETAVTTRMGNLFPAHREWMQALPRLTIGGEYQDMSAVEVLLSGAFPALRHGFRRTVTV